MSVGRGYCPSAVPGTRNSTPRSSFALAEAARSISASGIFSVRSGGEDPERLAYDGIILNLLPALITKHEHGSLPGLIAFIVARMFSPRRGRQGIRTLILLVEESLLLQASLLHFLRQG